MPLSGGDFEAGVLGAFQTPLASIEKEGLVTSRPVEDSTFARE
jgi:hypothetical protein